MQDLWLSAPSQDLQDAVNFIKGCDFSAAARRKLPLNGNLSLALWRLSSDPSFQLNAQAAQFSNLHAKTRAVFYINTMGDVDNKRKVGWLGIPYHQASVNISTAMTPLPTPSGTSSGEQSWAARALCKLKLEQGISARGTCSLCKDHGWQSLGSP
jgi:hypothetical protein